MSVSASAVSKDRSHKSDLGGTRPVKHRKCQMWRNRIYFDKSPVNRFRRENTEETRNHILLCQGRAAVNISSFLRDKTSKMFPSASGFMPKQTQLQSIVSALKCMQKLHRKQTFTRPTSGSIPHLLLFSASQSSH